MARLKQTYTALFSVDTTGEEVLFELAPTQAEYTDTMNGGHVRRALLSHGYDMTLDIPFGAKFIYVECTKTVTVRLDTTVDGSPVLGVAVPVVPMSSTFYGKMMLFTDGITSITVTNPGTTAEDDAAVTLVVGAVEAQNVD